MTINGLRIRCCYELEVRGSVALNVNNRTVAQQDELRSEPHHSLVKKESNWIMVFTSIFNNNLYTANAFKYRANLGKKVHSLTRD